MPMKATKACQTDSVVLCEDQVRHIVTQHVSDLKNKLERLETEIGDLKSTGTKLPSKAKLEQLMVPQLKKIQEETEHIRANCEKIASDLDSLNNLQQAAEIFIEQLQDQLATLEDDVGRRLDNFGEQLIDGDKIQDMEEKIDALDQLSRMKNLRILGLDETEAEDVTRTVINFAKEQMKIPISPTEINATRMGPIRPLSEKPRDILVHFQDQTLRNTTYQKRKMLRNQTKQVFINEHLTARRSYLFYKARQMRKQHKLFGAWTQAGNILVKINMDSTPREVNNIDVIKSLIKDNSSTDTESETTSFDSSNWTT